MRVRWMVCFMMGVITPLLTAEVMFRLLPVCTATQSDYHWSDKLVTYPPYHRWRSSTGWDLRNPQRQRSNQQGFLSDHDFQPDHRAIALIGDSYVESSMLSAADRPAAQLERLLDGRPVYAMGSPGTALLDYAERVRWARQSFGIEDVVILMEPGDIRQSLCGSGNVHSECLDASTLAPRRERRPSPSAMKRLVRRSALSQYIVSHLKVSASQLWAAAVRQSRFAQGHEVGQSVIEAAGPPSEPDLSVVDAVAGEFFRRVQAAGPGRLIIIVDTAISQRPDRNRLPDPERQRFITLAREAGASVIDAGPLYDRHFQTSTLSLDVGPYDGHLNRKGMELLMRAAAQALIRNQEESLRRVPARLITCAD